MLVTLGSIPRAGSMANWVRSTISDSSCVPRLCAPLLPRHGDLEPLLGRDQVIVVVIAEVDLHPFDSAGERVSARPVVGRGRRATVLNRRRKASLAE